MTTKVEIKPGSFVAVATPGQGPGLITVHVAPDADVFWQVANSQPAATDKGHVAENEDSWRLESTLSTGNSLWMRTNKSTGLAYFTADSDI